MPSILPAENTGIALAKAAQLEVEGQFLVASNILESALAAAPPGAQRKQIAFELDRLNRICQDFPLSQDDLFNALQQSVGGLTAAEFEQWVREGRFDSRVIDGRRWFMRSSVSNLYFRYPDLYARRMDGSDRTNLVRAFLASCRAIKQAASNEGTPYVLPKRFDMTMTVTANADVMPAGDIIRAWLPIPRNYSYQTNFEIISSSPAVKEIAPGDSSIRSAYFEQAAQAGQPAGFKLHYRYTRYGVWFDIDPKRVTPFDGNDPAVAKDRRWREKSSVACQKILRLDRRKHLLQLRHRIFDDPEHQRLLPFARLRRLRAGGPAFYRSLPSQWHSCAVAIRMAHFSRCYDHS
jgi:hypothetical protein